MLFSFLFVKNMTISRKCLYRIESEKVEVAAVEERIENSGMFCLVYSTVVASW